MRIVVATDGSRGGNAAVRFAVRLLGRDASAELIILTVRPLVSVPDPAPAKAEGAGPAPLPIARLAEPGLEGRVRYHAVPPRRGEGIPETISREASRFKADLLVIGSEGRDTLSEWVVGGVALRLIYVTRTPVTVVRPPRRRKGLQTAAS